MSRFKARMFRNAVSSVRPGDFIAYGEASGYFIMNYKMEKQPISSATISNMYGQGAFQRIIYLPIANANEFPTGSAITMATGPAITVDPSTNVSQAKANAPAASSTVITSDNSADIPTGSFYGGGASANPSLDPVETTDVTTEPVIEGNGRILLVGVVIIGGIAWLASKFK